MMRRGLTRGDADFGVETGGGLKRGGKPGTAIQFQVRELMAVAVLRRTLLLAGFMGLATAGWSSVINFDSPPAGLTANGYIEGSSVTPSAELTNQFENLGVIFSTASPGAPYAVLIDLGSGHAVSGTNGVGSAAATNVVDYRQDLDIFLVVPGTTTPAVTDAISIQGDEVPSGGQVYFTAYDVNGIQVASGQQTDTAGGTYSLSAPGIHEFRLHSANGDVAYDNLTFDVPTAPVVSGAPEPAAWGLVGAGLTVLLALRRKGVAKEL